MTRRSVWMTQGESINIQPCAVHGGGRGNIPPGAISPPTETLKLHPMAWRLCSPLDHVQDTVPWRGKSPYTRSMCVILCHGKCKCIAMLNSSSPIQLFHWSLILSCRVTFSVTPANLYIEYFSTQDIRDLQYAIVPESVNSIVPMVFSEISEVQNCLPFFRLLFFLYLHISYDKLFCFKFWNMIKFSKLTLKI